MVHATPKEAAVNASSGGQADRSSSGQPNNYGLAGDQYWDCPGCSTKNWASKVACRRCGSSKPAVVHYQAATAGMPGVRSRIVPGQAAQMQQQAPFAGVYVADGYSNGYSNDQRYWSEA